MKKAFTGLFSVTAFRNNYLAAAIITALFTLLQLASSAQPNSPLASSPKHDTTRVLQPINGDGFYWTGVGKFGGGLIIPNDTFKLSVQSKGALAYKNGKVYKYSGANWDELGIKKYLKSDGSIAITQNNDTINLATSTAPAGDRIIDYGGGVTLDDSTITAVPNIIVQRGPTKDTINSSESWDLNREADDYKRVYLVIVDSDNQLDTVRGEVLDTAFAVEPPLPAGAIKFATISVIGSSIEEPHLVSTWQRTAIVTIDDYGNQVTDSARLSFERNVNRINLGLGSQKVSITAVPPDYPGGSTALFRAENFQLQSTRTNGDGDLTLDLKSIGFRSPFNEFKFYMNSPGKYLNFGHFSPNAPYTYKFSTHSAYTDNDVVGWQFGYKNRLVGCDSCATSDSFPSALLSLKSLTKGFLMPRMSALEMNAIASPATGLQVFNTTANEPYYFNGTSWVSLAPSASSPQTLDDAATVGNEILNKTVVIKTNPAAYTGPEITFDPNGVYGGHLIVKGGIPLVTTEYHPLGFTNRLNTYAFPDGIHDSVFYLPTTFRLNGNYYSPNTGTGVVDFGTVSGGGSSFLPPTGTGTATGNVTGDLNGNTLGIIDGSVGIGTNTPDASALLDISSTTKGVLIPRMTQAERNAIASPATGLLIYQINNSPGLYEYNGSAWSSVGASAVFTSVPNHYYFMSSDGQASQGTLYNSNADDTTYLTSAKIDIGTDLTIGVNSPEATFVFGQDSYSECDNVSVFGRLDTAFGSGAANEASSIFGWNGKMASSPSSVLFALKGGIPVTLDTKPNTFKVDADSIILNAGINAGGHIIPGIDSNYSLGSSSSRFKDLWVASGSVHIGLATISSSGSNLSVGTIGSGIWNGTPITSAYGGTGVNNAGRTLTINTNSGTLAFGAASKTLTINNSIAITGTDGTTMTFPSTSATIARTDAAQTFTGFNTFTSGVQFGGGGAIQSTQNSGNNFSITWNTTNSTGATLLRNVADANAVVDIKQANASSTGDIVRFSNNSATVAKVEQNGALTVTGFKPSIVAAKTSNYTATAADHFIPVDASSGNITISFPASSTVSGLVLKVKKVDSSGNTVTIDPNGSETADGVLTKVISSQYGGYEFTCNGTGWYVSGTF